MAYYTALDIETTDEGDIIIDGNGDLKVASPIRTMMQGINSAVLTNKGELYSEPTWGSDIIKFYSETNSAQTRNFIRMNIAEAIRQQGLAVPRDVEIDVIAVDINTAAILVTVIGQYLDIDPDSPNFGAFITPADDLTAAYTYPFISGELTRVSTT